MNDRPTRDQIRAQRQDIIDQAIAYMDAAAPAALPRLLARAGSKQTFQDDPSLLQAALADADPDDAGPFFAAYKAAQRVLHAAGRYQYPN